MADLYRMITPASTPSATRRVTLKANVNARSKRIERSCALFLSRGPIPQVHESLQILQSGHGLCHMASLHNSPHVKIISSAT